MYIESIDYQLIFSMYLSSQTHTKFQDFNRNICNTIFSKSIKLISVVSKDIFNNVNAKTALNSKIIKAVVDVGTPNGLKIFGNIITNYHYGHKMHINS